jgi:hypothetical protein
MMKLEIRAEFASEKPTSSFGRRLGENNETKILQMRFTFSNCSLFIGPWCFVGKVLRCKETQQNKTKLT